MLDILDISPLFDTWIANMFPEFIGFYIFDVLLSTAVIILFNGPIFKTKLFKKEHVFEPFCTGICETHLCGFKQNLLSPQILINHECHLVNTHDSPWV